MKLMQRNVLAGSTILIVILISALGIGLFFLLRSSNEPMGAVATLSPECTDAATEILKSGGSAVDSAITTALCEGLTYPYSSGLGGGFVATIYIKETGTVETLNSREVAPAAAFKDMYPEVSMSVEGGLAIAVPGELKGLFELHTRYGKLKWEEIVQPAIDLAENGYTVTENLASFYVEYGNKIRTKPLFR